MKASTRILSIAAVALGAASTPVLADSDSGDSFKELSAQWWQWALSIPVASNPLYDPVQASDPTAVNCMVGQRGPVWFLGGATSGGTYRRTCSVPEGIALFFPVINSVNINTPGICGQVAKNLSVRELRALVAPFIDAATVVTAKVDNKPVKHIRRIRSEPFIGALPKDNLFVVPCQGDSPAGVYSPGVDDGYYVKLDGLPPGVHTLAFRAVSVPTDPTKTFNLDVEYILNVIPVSRQVKD